MSNATEFCKAVSEAACGQLETILAKLGIDGSDAIQGRHFIFPGCSKAKARFSDVSSGKGGCDCGCGKVWIDSISFVKQHLNIQSQFGAAKWVAIAIHREDLLPVEKPQPNKKEIDPAAGLNFVEFIKEHASQLVEAKPGLTFEGLKAIGAKSGIKQKKLAICIPVHSSIYGTKVPPVNYISIPRDGTRFEWKDKKGENRSEKILSQYGCKNGIAGSAEHVDKLTSGNVNDCRILITAGPGDLAAAHGAGLPPNILAITQAFGERGMPSSKENGTPHIVDLIASTGCEILIAYDTDETGKAASEKLANCFAGRGRKAKSIDLSRLELPGKDIRDFITANATMEQIIALADSTEIAEFESETKPTTYKNGKPVVILGHDIGPVLDQIIEHVGKDSNIYQMDGKLVEVIEAKDQQAKLWVIDRDYLPATICKAVTMLKVLEKKTGTEYMPITPPSVITKALYAKADYGDQVRRIKNIIHTPTVSSTGRLIQQPGFDAETQTIYRPDALFPTIPDEPTHDQVRDAVQLLASLFEDFPTKSTADVAAAITLPLTVLARPSIECVPAYGIGSNTPGTGKGLVCDVCNAIVTGRPAAKRTLPTKEDEIRKLITEMAIERQPIANFDNIASIVASPAIDAAVTSRVHRDRILGKSASTGDIASQTVLTFTGNNLRWGGDLSRRVMLVRLETDQERPEDRTGFNRPNLLQWVIANRPALVAASLTIIRAYFNSGCEKQPGVPWGSFEEWHAIIRGSVVWAGLGDPMETRVETKAEDPALNVLAALVAGMNEIDPKANGLTAKQIVDVLHRSNSQNYPVMRDAVSDLATDRRGNICQKLLGYSLRKFRGRIISLKNPDETIVRKKIEGEVNRVGLMEWRVVSAGDEAEKTTSHAVSHAASHAGLTRQNTGDFQFAGDAGDTFDVCHMESLRGTDTHRALSTSDSCAASAPALIPCPASHASPADDSTLCPTCLGSIVTEKTFDGHVNRHCEDCGRYLPCKKLEATT